jgi:cell shape-determining protein MreC
MTSISDLKNIADVLQKAGKTEELQKIYELQQQQLDMQSEIQELKKEKETLEAKLNEKEEMHFDKAKGVYVKNDEEDE